MEFKIIKQENPVIKINFDELKTQLDTNLEKYRNIEVTEENLPACKGTQKDLSALRRAIDTRRKEIKKVLTEPISAFETQCKILIDIVQDVERPVVAGIEVFNNKIRDEKREFAEAVINEVIEKYGLESEYANKLTVKDNYTNISVTKKAVKEDIEKLAIWLKKEQDDKKARLEFISTHIESTNSLLNLKTPLEIEMFKHNLNHPDILNIITNAGKHAKEVEVNAEIKAVEKMQSTPKPEPITQPVKPFIPEKLITPELKNNNSFVFKIRVPGERKMFVENFIKAHGFEYLIEGEN